MNQPAHVLIVDDNPMNRDALSRRLERRGYSVSTAESAVPALGLIDRESIDLVLLDIEMPGTSGMQLLKLLRERFSPTQLPVIMVTAKTQSTDIVAALKLGANDYITKPVDFPVALARIHTHLSHKFAIEALRESEERYALAVNGANDGLWDWDLKTNHVYFSPRWKAMLGCDDAAVGADPEEWWKRVHPEDLDRVRNSVAAHLNGQTPHYESEHRMLHHSGGFRWVFSRGLAVRDASGRATRLAGSHTDITAAKIADPLTNLPNRLLFVDHLDRCIRRTKRRPDRRFAVMLLDLDRFKMVNDSMGHSVGDQFLAAVAQRLEASLRSTDMVTQLAEGPTVARLGGDEFIVLLEDIGHVTDATRVADRLLKELQEPFNVNGRQIFGSASIGIAVSATGYDHSEEVLRDVDTALHQAKALGGASYELFDSRMRDQAVSRLRLETDLRKAVEARQFCTYYQPIICLRTGRIAGFEALVRWQHPERGLVSPAEFIPIAEETRMIVPIGELVLLEACDQTKAWHDEFGECAPEMISVNLSSKQLSHAGFIRRMNEILHETGLAPHSLKLEITESSFMENLDSTVAILQQLKQTGIQLGIDDFGTGYSSLSYLYKLPADMLKIDRSFVSRMGPDGEHSEIVRTIVTLAHNLNLKVIAEGVETAAQMTQLRELGCHYGQGFFFSKPVQMVEARNLIVALNWQEDRILTSPTLP